MSLVTGAIKVLDVPDDICVTTVRDLVQQLSRYLAVEFDEEKITNVIVSNTEPDTTNRDVLWWRIDNSGNLIGLHVFVQGEWVQIFPPPQQIIRMAGASNDLPAGYILADENVSWISEDMANHLKTSWFPDPEDEPEFFTIFDVVYVGV